MTINCYVFYAGQLIGQYSTKNFNTYKSKCGTEIYNGAYVYRQSYREHFSLDYSNGWFRMDTTPVLIEDVPKELRLLLLLLT